MVGSAHRWGVVNAVNVLQAVGFYSRVRTGSLAINHLLGRVIIALAVPAAVALFAIESSGIAGESTNECLGRLLF